MSLSGQILIGLALGLACGLFFGEYCAFLSVGGDAFIGLLQMTVLPYIAISLIANIGRLSIEKGRDLVTRAVVVLLVLLAIGVAALLAAPLCLPEWESAAFFSTSLVEPREQVDLVSLYIPSNPFDSFARNVVPAVVLFCILVGVALMRVRGTEQLLNDLDLLAQALNRVNSMIIRLTPLGLFAIAASTAGTMTLAEVGRLQAYLITYTVLALILGFWVLPLLITACTPFRYREVLGISKDTLITIFATAKIIVVLPQLIDNVKELYRKHRGEDDDVDSAADVLMPLAYPFPNLGTVAIMMFVPFAAWFLGDVMSSGDYLQFLGAGMLSSFVAPVIGIPFLLDLARIPADMFQLFAISTVYTDRIRVVVGAMHLLTLTILTIAMMKGMFRIDTRRLLRGLVVTVVLCVGAAVSIRGFLTYSFKDAYDADTVLVQMHMLRRPVSARIYRQDRPAPLEHEPGASRVEEIVERGFLRVCYLPDRLPFAFINEANALVGFDVEMAHELARDLNLGLEFQRIEPGQTADSLNAGLCDLAMTGLVFNIEKLREVSLSTSYLDQTLGFVTRDFRRGQFNSRSALGRLGPVRIGVVQSSEYWVPRLREWLPDVTVVPIGSPREYFRGRFEDLDALLYPAEAGSGWTLVYPKFSVAVPEPEVVQVPMAYAVPRGEREMVEFLDSWIELKKKDGTVRQLFEHWILGQGAVDSAPRWSVIRDVLHWVD
jgi:Na+/H+-dicarboxylate symporter/ABC-type amino acid transport substrate-binding protein